MKDKPILFSTEMVKAILEGRKTQTRRIVKSSRKNTNGDIVFCKYDNGWVPFESDDGDTTQLNDGTERQIFCPYQIGQTLWVRETWSYDRVKFIYKASHDVKIQWKPSIFMPKAAARIFLEVINIRIERLQEITNGDIVKEGYAGDMPLVNGIPWFIKLWNSINEKCGYGWDKNPYVWVIEFKKLEYTE